MATSKIGVIRAALKTAISAQLSGVNVFAFPPGDDALAGVSAHEFVALSGAEGTQNHLVFGGTREENIVLSGVLYAAKPGSGDTVFTTSEDRALVLLAGVEDALTSDDTPGANTFHGQVTNYRVDHGSDGERAWCAIEFDIEIESHI
jgi:hypothetical protein